MNATIAKPSTSLAVQNANFEMRYRAALRHSRLVWLLRIGIPVGALLALIALIAYSIIDPFKSIPVKLDIGSLKLEGSAIMMERAELKGYRDNNSPFVVTASKAVQDIKQPHIVNLADLRSDITMPDQTSAKIAADQGVYDTQKQILTVEGQVIVETRQYTMRMQSATVNFTTNSIESRDPVNVSAIGGVISANEFSVFDNGARILFKGRVRSVFRSTPEQ
jgi:lipopolysaccharide export system protein LptC